MTITVIGGLKGGSGKTTISTNLAVLRTKEGKKVLLIDADEQKSTSEWVAQREHRGIESNWVTIQLSGSSINSQVKKLKKDYDDIIIDVGGRDTTSQRSSLVACDMYIIPFKPRSLDIWTLGSVKNLIAEVLTVNPNMKSFAIVNQADAKGSDNIEAINLISECSDIKCFPFTIGHRKAFANAASDGLSVVEMKNPDKKAIEEINLLYKNIYLS